MTDQELLLAISDIVAAQIGSVKQDINDTRDSLHQEIIDTRTELQQQITENQKEIQNTRQLLEENIQDTRKIKLCLENNVLPRLQNIEACYTSTYKRYVDRIDQVDTIQRDVDILKKVVASHSKKLESLA